MTNNKISNEKNLCGLINGEAKKISFYIDEGNLNMIDELAKIFKTTRTMVLVSLITHGYKRYLSSVRMQLLAIRNKDNAKKNLKVDKALSLFDKFEKKWHMESFP